MWLNGSQTTKHIDALQKIQRRAMTMTLNSMRSTPTQGMEIIMDIRPIDIHLKEVALNSYIRMKKKGTWRSIEGEVQEQKNTV